MNVRRRMLLSGIFVLVAVVMTAYATNRSISNLLRAADEARERAEAAQIAQEIRASVHAVIAAQRGFLLSGDDEMLAPYHSGMKSFEKLLGEATSRAEWARQQDRLEQIENAFERWIVENAEPEIAARREVEPGGEAEFAANIRASGAAVAVKELEALLSASADLEDRLTERKVEAVRRSAQSSIVFSLLGAVAVVIVTIFVSWRTASAILFQVGGEPAEIEALSRRVAENDPGVQSAFSPETDTGIKASFYQMLQSLRSAEEENLRRLWVEQQLNEIWDSLQGVQSQKELARIALSKLCAIVEAGWGALYSAHNASIDGCALLASYAIPALPVRAPSAIAKGLIYEAALGGKAIDLKNVPANYVPVQSGLGGRTPKHVSIIPLVHDRRPVGVLELALFNDTSVQQRLLLDHLAPRLAVLLRSAGERPDEGRMRGVG